MKELKFELSDFYDNAHVVETLTKTFTFEKIDSFIKKVTTLFHEEFEVSIEELIKAVPPEKDASQKGGAELQTGGLHVRQLFDFMYSVFKRFCLFIQKVYQYFTQQPTRDLRTIEERRTPAHQAVDISAVFNLLFNILGLIYAFGTAFFIILFSRILRYFGMEYDFAGKKRPNKSNPKRSDPKLQRYKTDQNSK